MSMRSHKRPSLGSVHLPPVRPPSLPPGVSDHKLLVIGIDGLRWDRVTETLAPRLTALAVNGLLGLGLHPRNSPAKTMSGPGWATLATGVWPAKHGVRDNDFVGQRFDRHPSFLTLAARERPGLSTYVAIDWPPLCDTGLFGPDMSARVRLDGETFGYFPEDRRLLEPSVTVLAEQDPDAAFIYIGCVDYAGHERGPLSSLYTDAIVEADGMVGRLVDAVAGRSSYAAERWLVLVGTDHGHRDRGGHGGRSEVERAIFVIANGHGITPGTRLTGARAVDIAPTALAHLNVVPRTEWALDGRSLLAPISS
jgi:hypothetical protein